MRGLRGTQSSTTRSVPPRSAIWTEPIPVTPFARPSLPTSAGLPPVLVLVGTHEILYDDAVSFADLASQAGVDVELEIGHELIHVWPIFPITPEAVASVARVGRFLGVSGN